MVKPQDARQAQQAMPSHACMLFSWSRALPMLSTSCRAAEACLNEPAGMHQHVEKCPRDCKAAAQSYFLPQLNRARKQSLNELQTLKDTDMQPALPGSLHIAAAPAAKHSMCTHSHEVPKHPRPQSRTTIPQPLANSLEATGVA